MAVVLAVGVAVVVDEGDSGGGHGGGSGGGVGGEGDGDGGCEGGGQGSRKGGGRGVLIFDLLLISFHFSQLLYYSYYLLLVSQPHPLRRCVFFFVLTTSPTIKPTTSFATMCVV